MDGGSRPSRHRKTMATGYGAVVGWAARAEVVWPVKLMREVRWKLVRWIAMNGADEVTAESHRFG